MSLKNPVKYPVKYYSHLDAGAPQLADTDGVIKTILKACLVTGYGTKAGAGWTALFDDAFRIVLRRPLRTGNPPDIKIENGVINGVSSHRIVSQDNPTGLEDSVELASVNLLARDSKYGQEWHLFVSDFAFILCYQMAEYVYTGDKNSVLYCGSMQKMRDSDLDFFVVNQDTRVARDGKGGAWLRSLLDDSTQIQFVDMRSGTVHTSKAYIKLPVSELYFNDDYTAQNVIIANKAIPPFYCSVASTYTGLVTKNVSINNRPMLRYVNKTYQSYGDRPLYIPLDYWEL